MPEPEVLLDYILKNIAKEKDMEGMKVLVTAGPTREAIDPVRYITNHSTGKMGYALAKMAMLRGAKVTLVTGPTTLKRPPFVEVVEISSAREMFEAVTGRSEDMDVIIKAAAVADYRPAVVQTEKMKKKDGQMSLELEKTDDILKYLGERKAPGQFLCGFSMETEHMLENSRAKLEKKNLDMVAANNLKQAGAGFGTDTNIITLITKDQEISLEQMSKENVADRILDQIQIMRRG
jgi:phosphopantothenoylcysteine decarboxylase/phosphopantothenate--cysteine ligase